ncbi:protein kinase domain-containing protein [Alkalicoccobacillus murimartini]|uniref:Serine/threonine-protein kinase n=1 Tax=Alkalicoccobacillus murimartini TaxID=171685 RepID=A0ABT9YP08_9BACI|nr:protein kinase family protein [Alkalicoccobacillus murimartini]MDQ0209221.1 serine/threonine-protein kinase [Alkalicoccobacillus murimartini]
MRNSYSTKSQIKIPIGSRIKGKWHTKSYTVIRMLGEGATGSVYLCQSNGGLVAIKVGIDSMAITTEVNVLRKFSEKQGVALGPKLLDVDDFVMVQQVFPFYAMEYIKGEALIPFMRGKGPEWLGLISLQLLGDLEKLHKEGWVFGDLKPDNLLVTGPPSRVRWLDVGGTTILGRSIKEYTEFYDRGYWTMGSRKAEPSYDLFSVAMIMINCAYPNRFDKKSGQPIQQLKMCIKGHPLLKTYETVLIKALQGNYPSASTMKKDLTLTMQRNAQTDFQPRARKKTSKQKQKRQVGYKVEIILSGSLVVIGCLLYLFVSTM